MKNYVAPVSNKLALNLTENIARSEGVTKLHVLYDLNTGLIINTSNLFKGDDVTRTQRVLEWIREHSEDTAINSCYS